MDLYRELILDHYKHPRNFGHLDHSDATASDNNITCGDQIVMEIHTSKRKKGKKQEIIVEDIRFSGEGCAINQASASMLTEKVVGLRLEDILKLKTEDIEEMLGTELTPSRIKCAVLPLEVLQKAAGKIKSSVG